MNFLVIILFITFLLLIILLIGLITLLIIKRSKIPQNLLQSVFLPRLFWNKKNIYKTIDDLTSQINTNKNNSLFLYNRGMLYLMIKEPETSLVDFIECCRYDKKFIKKCKYACGKYHPLLLEKFMSAVFYQIDTDVIKPFVK